MERSSKMAHLVRTLKAGCWASCLVLFAAMPAWADFSSYCDLTVVGYDANRATLANFPVLVRISKTRITGFSYSQLQSDGKDLAFTSTDGETTYPHEIDTWDTDGESLVWVLLPSMKYSTTFRMNWGDDSITAAPAYTTSGQMWVDAGYVGVWHLGEQDPAGWTVGTLVDGVIGYSRDSSANALHGTNNVQSSHISDGAIGGARKATASSRSGAGVCVPGWIEYMDTHWNANFTASAWVRHNGSMYYDTILGSKSDLTGKVAGWAFGFTSSYSRFVVYGGSNIKKEMSSFPGSQSGGGWQKVDVSYASYRDVYTNGAPFSVDVSGANGATKSGLSLGIGANSNGTGGWLGDLDEVRVSSSIRSEDWIAADYDTVGNLGFLSFGTVVSDTASLIVSGDPENLGTSDPAYGTITAIAAGDSFTASVALPVYDEEATERWICTGYTHYEIVDPITGVKAVRQEGGTSSFPYTHVKRDELVWHFTNEWLVAVSATSGGTVSVGNAWVRNAETITITATPESGCDFWGWVGDTEGIADISAMSISPSITAARSLRAVFTPPGADASIQYVSTMGNDEYNGYFESSPKLTVQAAIDTLANSSGYGTVHVAPGTYVYAGTVSISNAIAVLGVAGDPEKVVIHADNIDNSKNRIALMVNHAGALVANLSIENAHRYAPGSPYGGNVSIDSAGGTVSNCIIRSATSTGNYARGTGAWLNSKNALLTHCVITNNSANGFGYQTTDGGYGGMFVHVEKGTVANCLIANNRDLSTAGMGGQDKQSWSSGVTIQNGGCILNSTVATNEAPWVGGIYLYPNGVATNVVVAGCVCTCRYPDADNNPMWNDIGFKGTLANASHCASDGGEELTDKCIAGTAAEFFRDFSGGDWRPALDSPLVNAGIAYDGIASFDLLGKKRVQGRAPDIGCYESAPSGLSVVIR